MTVVSLALPEAHSVKVGVPHNKKVSFSVDTDDVMGLVGTAVRLKSGELKETGHTSKELKLIFRAAGWVPSPLALHGNQPVTKNPFVCGGAPCVAGTRIEVGIIAELRAQGASNATILAAYPQLTQHQLEEVFEWLDMPHDA